MNGIDTSTVRMILLVTQISPLKKIGFIDKGELTYAGPDGELIRELPTRIDVWGVGDDEGNYDHWYYNGPDDYGKAPDGRHNN